MYHYKNIYLKTIHYLLYILLNKNKTLLVLHDNIQFINKSYFKLITIVLLNLVHYLIIINKIIH